MFQQPCLQQIMHFCHATSPATSAAKRLSWRALPSISCEVTPLIRSCDECDVEDLVHGALISRSHVRRGGGARPIQRGCDRGTPTSSMDSTPSCDCWMTLAIHGGIFAKLEVISSHMEWDGLVRPIQGSRMCG